MTILPLVDIFPLAGKPPPVPEQARQAAMGDPWVQQHYPLPSDVWQALLVQHDHPAGIAFLESLDGCREYKTCLRAMPALKLVPAVRSYRNDKRDKWNYPAIDAEMALHGLPLSVGQVLYHGGEWNGGSTMAVGATVTVPRVLSTSWTPQVALTHARSVPGRCLFVLRIAPGMPVRALPLKNRKNEQLGHEREVLVEAGVVLTCTKVHVTGKVPVIECSMGR